MASSTASCESPSATSSPASPLLSHRVSRGSARGGSRSGGSAKDSGPMWVMPVSASEGESEICAGMEELSSLDSGCQSGAWPS